MGKEASQPLETPSASFFVPSKSNSSTTASSQDIVSAAAPFHVADTPLFLTTSLAHLKDALDVIPAEAKKDYLEAVRLAPSLIQKESNPIQFLRSEDYNPWQTAKKLVLHWEYRKWLFKDRWLYQLLDTSGAGALTESDVALLHTGWLAWVTPRQDPQKYGRFLVVDHGRFQNFTLDSFLRVLFYLGTAASDAVAQTTGVTSLRLIPTTDNEPPMSMALFQMSQTSYKMMKEALPMRLKRVVFLKQANSQRGDMVHYFLQRMGSSVVRMLQGNAAPITIEVPSAAQAADELVDMGFPRDAIPDSHGGSWTYQRLLEWQTTRGTLTAQSSEEQLVKIPWLASQVQQQQHQEQKQPSETDLTISGSSSNGAVGRQPPQQQAAAQQQDVRTKEVSALHARRAYQKRKLKQNETEQRAQALRAENERLKAENALLESLLQQAADVVALLDGGVDDDFAAVVGAGTAGLPEWDDNFQVEPKQQQQQQKNQLESQNFLDFDTSNAVGMYGNQGFDDSAMWQDFAMDQFD